MKKTLLGIILGIAIALPISIYAVDTVTAYITKCNIYYRDYFFGNKSVMEKIQLPLLSYGDKVYISVDDMARIIGRNAGYDFGHDETAGRLSIYLNRSKEKYAEGALVQSKEMALSIGKTVIENYYSDRLTDSTMYCVDYRQEFVEREDNHYRVTVKFKEPSKAEIIQELGKFDDKFSQEELGTYFALRFDVQLKIDPIDGTVFSVMERDANGRWVEIPAEELNKRTKTREYMDERGYLWGR